MLLRWVSDSLFLYLAITCNSRRSSVIAQVRSNDSLLELYRKDSLAWLSKLLLTALTWELKRNPSVSSLMACLSCFIELFVTFDCKESTKLFRQKLKLYLVRRQTSSTHFKNSWISHTKCGKGENLCITKLGTNSAKISETLLLRLVSVFIPLSINNEDMG